MHQTHAISELEELVLRSRRPLNIVPLMEIRKRSRLYQNESKHVTEIHVPQNRTRDGVTKRAALAILVTPRKINK